MLRASICVMNRSESARCWWRQAPARVRGSVREALQPIDAERFDAVVSDIGLPGEDGYALIRQIRQYEAEHGGSLPAVALTGFARAEDRARILAAGFQAH